MMLAQIKLPKLELKEIKYGQYLLDNQGIAINPNIDLNEDGYVVIDVINNPMQNFNFPFKINDWLQKSIIEDAFDIISD